MFTNRGSVSCTMFGFPGFELLTATTDTTYSPPRQGIPSASVVLARGSSAHALFTYDTEADVCGADTTSWTPTEVATIPPDETTPLTVKWPGGSFDMCSPASGGLYSSDASIGSIEPGSAPSTPSSGTVAAAQTAVQALYPPSTEDYATFESSGVVTSGLHLWLAIATEPAGSRAASVAVYRWLDTRWVIQGTVSVPGFGFLDGGSNGSSVGTDWLTGSPNPDFLVNGNGADTEYLSVVSDVGGSWHAVSFDVGPTPSAVANVGIVTGNVIWGEVDLCGCAGNEPAAYEWFQYVNGVFSPANPLGPAPTCSAQQFDNAANTTTATTGVSFVSASCDDGWALAKGTSDGATVVGLFNWQTGRTSQWISEDVGSVSDLANDPEAFTVPVDLLNHLAADIGVAVPSGAG